MYLFDEQSIFGDWTWVYDLYDIEAWTADDRVIAAFSPDNAPLRDDYGMTTHVSPWAKFNSVDHPTNVVLSGAGIISLWIPASTLRQLGPGSVTVGLGHQRLDTGVIKHLTRGRLPLIDTGGA